MDTGADRQDESGPEGMVAASTPLPPQPVTQSRAKRRLFGRIKNTFLRRTLIGLGLCTGLVFAMLAGWFGYCALDMPDTAPLFSPKRTPEIIVRDRHDREISRSGGTGITPVDLDTLPPALTQALIATEDKRFYHHFGFDPIGLARAAIANARAGHVVQGGSTLTQQLAKNIFLTRKQTLKRKTQELMLAVWLEMTMSKKEILETYLSRVYFGGGTLGIESGAERYFHKPARDLSTGEAAFLVGLLKAPDRYNPLKHRKAAAERTAFVLGRMYLEGYLDADAYRTAMTKPIAIEPMARRKNAGAGYFTDWVLFEMDRQLGRPKTDITIRTTLDLDLQAQAEAAVLAGLSVRRNAQQGALVSFDGTGAVLAMVGGADYRHSAFNRAIAARRQPGSAFKPFVYLAALLDGHTPWEIYTDAPIDIDGWQPTNYSNTYRGEMTLEAALAHSVNTIAVQLAEQVGRDKVVATAARMGLAGLKPYASLALGAQEVSLYDLSAAYIPFANWGFAARPYGIDSIFSKDGHLLYEHSAPPRARILSQRVLRMENLMLKSVVEKGTGRAARIPGHDIAGKTGTTDDYRDAWFIGYSPDLVTGVWVGNDDNSKMARVTGGSIPAQIWQSYMQAALASLPAAARAARLPVASPPPDIQKQKKLDHLLADLEKALP